MSHKGSCHCGQVKFEVKGDFDSAMECNCSICSRKGYLLWFVSRGDLKVSKPAAALTTYTFNKHVIQHQFCPKCGCAPFGFATNQGQEMAAVNIRCLEDVDLATVKRELYNGRAI